MKVLTEPRSPAAQAFNRSARELVAALAETKRLHVETERFLEAMGKRPLSRPEARVEK